MSSRKRVAPSSRVAPTVRTAPSAQLNRVRRRAFLFGLMLACVAALSVAALGWADPQSATEANNPDVVAATQDTQDTSAADNTASNEDTSISSDPNQAAPSDEEADRQSADEGTSEEAAVSEDADEDSAEADIQGIQALGAPIGLMAAGNQNQGSQLRDSLDTDDAYLSHFAVGEVLDGTGPFDDDNSPGNDQNDHNKIVRTFDTLTYYLDYATRVYSEGVSYKEGYVWFESTIPVDSSKATFDTDAMGWMSTDPGYQWEVTENPDGTQTLRCAKRLEAQSADAAAFPGQGQVYITMKIGAMSNGDTFKPTFKAWVDHNTTDGACGNESTYIKGDHEETKAHSEVNEGIEVREAEAPGVEISAAPKYNVQIKQVSDGYVYEQNKFDFNTGDDDAPNKGAGEVNGRMIAYGITLQLYNDNADKGLKGIEIPQGPITFDMKVESSFIPDHDKDNPKPAYQTLLWSGGEHDQAVKQGRAYGAVYPYAPFCAPQNKASDAEKTRRATEGPAAGTLACYDGGDWTVTQGSDGTIHFTVDNYEVNPDWFPNADWGVALRYQNTYFNPETGVTNIGGFSSGKIHVVLPFGEGADYLPTKYGDDGSLQVRFTEGNLKATSVTGQTTPAGDAVPSDKQPNTADDQGSRSVVLLRPGSFRNYIQYTYGGDTTYTWRRDVNNVPNFYQTGEDALPIGAEVGVMWGINCNPYGTTENSMKGVDMLLKFDDAALEFNPKEVENAKTGDYASETVPNGVLASGGNFRNWTTFYFAAKPDGSGWDHQGQAPDGENYDDEMAAATIEDLVYYNSYDALVADGKTCVGIVASYRDNAGTAPRSNGMLAELRNKAWFTVKNDQAITKGVYEILEVSNVWTFESHPADVPALSNMNNAAYRSGRIMFDKTNDNPEGVPYHTDDYTKATYDANGGYQGGDSGSYYYGDSLYVVGYKASILKDVAQTDTSGNAKTIYDLDFGQFTVDYRLRPSMDTEAGVDMSGYSTTAIITDTLPAGVEYIGPSYWGGTYTEAARRGQSGTVEDAEEVSPEITNNEDGTTTLVWQIPNVPIQRDLPTLIFKAQIDSEASANQTYKNVVTIATPEDQRPPAVAAGNMSEYSIRTAKTSDMAVTKRAEQRVSDVNSDIVYNMTWSNNGNRDYEMEVMLDAMPQDGDSRASGFSGGYDITELKVTLPNRTRYNDDAHAYTVWYTTDAAGTELASEDVTAAEIKAGFSGGATWVQAPVDAEGVASIQSADSKKVTAWAILGPLEKKAKVRASLVMLPDGNAAGDHYTNQVSIGYTGITSTTYIVNRVLRGTTWIDANMDGERQDDERRLPGVTVTVYAAEFETDDEGNPTRDDNGRLVYKKDADGGYIFSTTPAKNLDGDTCQMLTIEDDPETEANEGGTYEFTNMPEGIFKVVFTKGTVNLGAYIAAPTKAEGVADSVNSDATPTYSDARELLNSYIEGIDMPPAAELQTSPYLVQFQDAGFFPLSQIAVSKQVSGNAATDEQKNAEYTFTLTVLDEEGNPYTIVDAAENELPRTYPFEITGGSDEATNDAADDTADTTDNADASDTTDTAADTGEEADNTDSETEVEAIPQLASGDTFTLKDGQTITFNQVPAGANYRIAETTPEGMVVYVANGTADEAAGANAAGNTPEGDVIKVAFRNDNSEMNLQFTKKWDDNNDFLGLRPSAADFASAWKLFDNEGNAITATPTITDNGDGTYTIAYENLPKFRASGAEITYSAVEDSIPGYYPATYTANASGSGAESSPTAATDGGTVTNTVRPAAVSIAKTVAESSVLPGQELHYTIVVTNTTDIPAKDWIVTDTLGENLSFIEASFDVQASSEGAQASEPTTQGQDTVWTVTIPANGHATLLLTAKVAEGATDKVENIVTARDPNNPNEENPPTDTTSTPIPDPEPEPTPAPSKVKAPKRSTPLTGDMLPVVPIAALTVLAVGLAYVRVRKEV